MKHRSSLALVLLVGLLLSLPVTTIEAQEIPAPLRPWQTWATWDDEHRGCPTPYSDTGKHLCFWPSRMGLQVDRSGGVFDLALTVFHQSWVPLPGGDDTWPLELRANGTPIPVVKHDGRPSVQLEAGTFLLEGRYRWNEVPQRLSIPPQIGMLVLAIDGKPVEAPVWNSDGILWLKRDASTEEADKNFLSVKLHGALEDGNPLWLRHEIELIVSGKSREEDIGTILPEGWKLASVESPIPVAVDDAGRMKAQVRAGKWIVHANAFRFDNPKELKYAEQAKPAVPEVLLALRARPEFRVIELVGAPSIDVSQTTFPTKWRDLPVYRWEVSAPIRIEERMRGMGEQKPEGLHIVREWWLDERGAAFTFRDRITGKMQQIWRLDAADGQDLGSVRSGGQGQLITRNPQTNAPGVEIRTRNLDLEATGRMARAENLPATGWRSDADALSVTLHLPPGWRLFALFGADWVKGDWLTSWTLLDLFLLLVFTLAVLKLWGFLPALLALFALVVSYHEPGAPRYTWMFLLASLALLRVMPAGSERRLIVAIKWVALLVFMLVLVPFVVRQVQQALYPQLERVSSSRVAFAPSSAPQSVDAEGAVQITAAAAPDRQYAPLVGSEFKAKLRATKADNLAYDTKARIQTGPGVPEWSWRRVSFGWNGPVTASQQIKPLLISLPLERLLTVLRIASVLALLGLLLRRSPSTWRGNTAVSAGSTAAALFLLFASRGNVLGQTPETSAPTPNVAISEPAEKPSLGEDNPTAANRASGFPDEAMLEKLRERLLKPSDAYPHAADIPLVTLGLADRRLTLDAEIHTAVETAVPLPGLLPGWSPLAITVNDKPEVALRRDDGYLWVSLPKGVHRVHVEGALANLTEWEWTFLLKPRQVKIEAPDWNVSGVKPDGVPEAQVFFTRKQKTAGGLATYDRQDYQAIVSVERHLELGLVWQVRTTVTRLSPLGKALALRIPLLPRENVLSSSANVRDGFIEVRLGAQEQSTTWESGLAFADSLALATRAEDTWVERWHLVASPIWNVAITGLPPIFESDNAELIPVWQPWPGENVGLSITRPESIAGATVTVDRGSHTINLGKRQRVSNLQLSIRSSLGEDFRLQLPASAEVTTLTQNDKPFPVRIDANQLVIPLRPGEQKIQAGWKINEALQTRAVAEAVRLPVESANFQTIMTVPEDRWVLWASGPTRGPAVRFWGVLVVSLLAAIGLGRVRIGRPAPGAPIAKSPLRTFEWMLLGIGLTQVPLPAAIAVVAWLFFLAWRGTDSFQQLGPTSYNVLQFLSIAATLLALGILLVAVGEGLLGRPDMFITGNGSTQTSLRWFEPRAGDLLPQPGCFSISIWWYRFAMLAWALWLAASLIRWLRTGWENLTKGGFIHKDSKAVAPPPLPTK